MVPACKVSIKVSDWSTVRSPRSCASRKCWLTRVLVIKFWFHLSKADQKKRLKELEKDPKTRWRVTDADWKTLQAVRPLCRGQRACAARTSTGYAPWTVVSTASDPRYRSHQRRQASCWSRSANACTVEGRYHPAPVRRRSSTRIDESQCAQLAQSHAEALDEKKYDGRTREVAGQAQPAFPRPASFKSRSLIAGVRGQ
jgi:hypothetical protein